jgi:hypothetical protein
MTGDEKHRLFGHEDELISNYLWGDLIVKGYNLILSFQNVSFFSLKAEPVAISNFNWL